MVTMPVLSVSSSAFSCAGNTASGCFTCSTSNIATCNAMHDLVY